MSVDSETFKKIENQGNLETLPETQCEGYQADWEDQVDQSDF